MKDKKSIVLSIRIKPEVLLGVLDHLENLEIDQPSMGASLIAFIENNLARLYDSGSIKRFTAQEANQLLPERIALAGKLVQQRLIAKQSGLMAFRVSNASREQKDSLREAISMAGLTSNEFDPGAVFMNFDETSPDSPSNPTLDIGHRLHSDFKFEEDKGFGLEDVLKLVPETKLEDLYPGQKADFSFDDLDDLMLEQIAEMEAEEQRLLMQKLSIGTVPVLPGTDSTQGDLAMISDKDPRLEKDKLWKVLCKAENEQGKKALRIVYNNLAHEYWSSEKAEHLLLQISKAI